MPSDQNIESLIAWLPELIFTGGRFESGFALVCNSSGTIVRLARVDELKDEKKINLPNRALLPGMINSHSHAFQRVLRGRTEFRMRNVPFSGGLPPADLEASHDRRTDEVIAAILKTGEAFFGGTTWRGRRAMRISVTNWRTTDAEVDRVVEAVASVLGARR